MRTSDFDYELPRELIAQYPAERRDESRLLVLRRESGEVEHRLFHEVVEFIRSGDVLFLNESEVIPARLLGRREGGGKAEMFLLRPLREGSWEALVRPGAKIREGSVLSFGEGRLSARVTRALPGGRREVDLDARGDLTAALNELGRVPLPPYIDREPEPSDKERYQTVYARVPGAVAAPTAGLHFTDRLLASIAEKGAVVVKAILHVGLGTFRPITVDDPDEHEMEVERYEISDAAAGAVNAARAEGRRIIAVGTTSVRMLEAASDESGRVCPGSGATNLFIKPGYRFKCVDVLVTNFHLPRSTLLMLVCAFGGRDRILAAYEEAVRERYRFYSYGDAMLLV